MRETQVYMEWEETQQNREPLIIRKNSLKERGKTPGIDNLNVKKLFALDGHGKEVLFRI